MNKGICGFFVVHNLAKAAERHALPALGRGRRSRPARKMIRRRKLLEMCARPPDSPQRQVVSLKRTRQIDVRWVAARPLCSRIAISVRQVSPNSCRVSKTGHRKAAVAWAQTPLYKAEAGITTSSGKFGGIDVAKEKLDIAVLGETKASQVGNDEVGIVKLIKKLRTLNPELIAVEATGGYQRAVVLGLYEAGLPVAVVNPARVR